MKKIKIFNIAILIIVTHLFIQSAFARDLAGIEWEEFKNKSEFVFSGQLIKAELIENKSDINYTYRISNVFKGEQIKIVSFKAPSRENINKTIGSIAVVALKKVNDEWKLSIDERSCWKHENEIKEDFGGFPIYKIPTVLLYNFPKELGEKVKLKKLYQDGYRVEEIFVYPIHKVDKYLGTYLNNDE